MSTLHGNARRHRQLLKKRVSNDLNDFTEKKRDPPFGFANAPDVPPVGGGTVPPVGNPSSPNPVKSSSPVVPVRPSTTPIAPVRPTPTSQSTPQVPVVPKTTSSSAIVATSAPASSTVLSSSTTSSIITTPLNQATTAVLPPTTFVTVPNGGSTFSVPPSISPDGFANSGAAPSATSTAGPSTSNDLSTGSVVGIVAAGLIAVAAIVVVGMWLAKRFFKNRDEAEFDRNSFIRQSVHIPDEDDAFRPRPPTMIERHKGAYNAQQATYGNNMYAPPVPPMPTIQPGEMMMANQAAMANPFAANPVDQYGMPVQDQTALVRVPSNGSSHSYNDPNGQYQQYQGQNMAMGEHLPPVQGQGYATLERTSVTPYQAAQYAEISRQLNIQSVTNSPVSPAFGRLPTPSPQRAMSPQGASPQRMMSPLERVMSPNSIPVGGYTFPMPAQAPQSVAHAAALAALGKPTGPPSQLHPQEQVHEERPRTVYEEDDAYGGM